MMNIIEPNSSLALQPMHDAAPRRVITLKVDDVVSGQGVRTAEFELPDAEFDC